MIKIDKVKIFKNVGSSWFALGVTVIVGFFLSPFILHHLGDDAFGLWVLIFSVTGYYGLFDFGIRSSIVRYVARYAATGNFRQLNLLINTAMISYAAIGLVCLLITAVGTYYVDTIFRVPAEFLRTARWLFVMVGTSVALGFPLGVFSGVLEGMQHFVLTNLTSLTSTLLRATLILITLRHGKGLLTVAFITVAFPLLAALVNAVIVVRILPLHLRLRDFDFETLSSIAKYSGATFMIIVAGRLRFKTDAMIIGTFISASAITYFAIGSRLLDYASEVVSSLSQIFVPMSSQLDATSDVDRLKKIVVAGNRACSFIIFPIATILAILGKSVIEVWMGMKYVSQSYPVLLILLTAYCLMLSQAAGGRVLLGMAKHKTLAIVTMVEGVANVVLSMILVRHFGIIGDALGTAIPLSCTMLFFLPIHVCRLLKINLASYVREAFTLPLILCMPLAGTLLGIQYWRVSHNYVQLCTQLLVGGAVYGTGLLWAFWTQRAWRMGDLQVRGAESQIELVDG